MAMYCIDVGMIFVGSVVMCSCREAAAGRLHALIVIIMESDINSVTQTEWFLRNGDSDSSRSSV